MKNDEWVEPEPPQPADQLRPMRRLAQAVLVQAVADFKTHDPRLRALAAQFLFPTADRQEDLRLTIELSALGDVWMAQRLTQLRKRTRPIHNFRRRAPRSRPDGPGGVGASEATYSAPAAVPVAPAEPLSA